MNRREFIVGAASIAAAALVPVVTSDPLVRFVKYQSWPFDEERPHIDYWAGSIGSLAPDAPRYRLSKLLRPHMIYYKAYD